MAKPNDLVMRVEADPEKVQALENAIRDFRNISKDLEDSIIKVKRAVSELEFRANVVSKEESDG